MGETNGPFLPRGFRERERVALISVISPQKAAKTDFQQEVTKKVLLQRTASSLASVQKDQLRSTEVSKEFFNRSKRRLRLELSRTETKAEVFFDKRVVIQRAHRPSR
jgi:hypothetical protein